MSDIKTIVITGTTKGLGLVMTRALAQDLPSGLATVALNPGIIDTEMLRSCWGGGASSFPDPPEWAQIAEPYILSLKESNNGDSLGIP